jgi:hypothetical protein
MSCKRCGSYAINPHLHGRDDSRPDLCDVCYWRDKAEIITPLAQHLLYVCQHVLHVLNKPPPNKPGGVSRAFLRDVIDDAKAARLKPECPPPRA